jgi:hypothetical protein
MISNSASVDDEAISGQLKTVVLNKEIAVSYSGPADKAVGKIREVRNDLANRVYFEEVLESLSEFTRKEGESVDFIVSSHISIPKLYKIAGGEIHYGLDMYWIGNEGAVSRVLKEIEKGEPVAGSLPRGMTTEEKRFREAFRKVVSGRNVPQAGGFVFDCIGSKDGYYYNTDAGVHTGSGMSIGISFDYAPGHSSQKPGSELSLVSPNGRSLPLAGAYFEESHMGYIYSPLDPHLDRNKPGSPEMVYPVTLQGFVSEVERCARRLELYLGR